MKPNSALIPLILALGLLLAAGLAVAGAVAAAPVSPAPAARRVCAATCDYATVQAAVDAAAAGDLIQVAAGTYTDIHAWAGITQVVCITKSLTIRGGYTPAFTEPPDPVANPTTLDAGGQGRVVYIAGPGIAVTLEGLRLTGGDATGLGGDIYGYDAGGGVCVVEARAILSGSLLAGNTAYEGGGLYGRSAGITLVGSQVSGNSATVGGGLHQSNGYGCPSYPTAPPNTLTIDHSTLLSNTARASGAGLYVYCTLVNLVDSTVAENVGGTAGSGSGGGLSADYSFITVTGTTLRDNTASTNGGGGGGGLYVNHGAVALLYNIIQGNKATTRSDQSGLGGGVYLHNYAYYPYLTLTGNVIISNTAGPVYGLGGGAYLFSYTNIDLSNNLVQGNVAGSDSWGTGGGIALTGQYVRLNGNIIRGNTAGSGGGAWLKREQYGCVMSLNSNVVADNAGLAGGQGSGLHLSSIAQPGCAPARLLHNTLARNHGGDGSGVYVASGTVLVTNTIFYSHTVGLSNGGGAVSLDHTLWDYNDTNIAGLVTTSNDIPASALFAADGYHLTDLSAAVEAGADVGLADDVDGQQRPMGAAPDIGADEFPNYLAINPLVGGSLTYTDTQGLSTTVVVPPGALSETIILTLAPRPEPSRPPLPGLAFIDHAFDLDAWKAWLLLPGYLFSEPISITVHYGDADVAGIYEDTLRLYYWTGSTWADVAGTCSPPSGYSRDLAGNVLAVAICHLTEYNIQGVSIPPPRVYLPLILRRWSPAQALPDRHRERAP